MTTQIAILLIGFSIIEAFIIIASQFRLEKYQNAPQSRFFGATFVLLLALLQGCHYAYLQYDIAIASQLFYQLLLFGIAPTFFLYSAPLLYAKPPQSHWLLHYLPLLFAFILPEWLVFPLVFSIGVGYLAWLCFAVVQLRQQRQLFRYELALLSAILLIAIAVVGMGLFESTVSPALFFSLYAIAIGLAFVLISLLLAQTPMLSDNIIDAARRHYKISQLNNIDSQQKLAKLNQLMQNQKLYQNPELNLKTLAKALGMSPHQLSELLNAQLGKSFSRYMRERRVNAAKDMLVNEMQASILSIGLSVGFSAQSSFYAAFREIEGMTPGQYRNLAGQIKTAP